MREFSSSIAKLMSGESTELERNFKLQTLRRLLPALSIIFLATGYLVIPLRFGWSIDLFSHVNFLGVNVLLIVSLVTYIAVRHGYVRYAALVLPITFLLIGVAMLSQGSLVESTPFVPFYAAIAGITTAAAFLSIRHLTLYLLVFVFSFFPVLAMTDMTLGEQLHRSSILVMLAPFLLTMAIMRERTFQELESQTRRLIETANLQSLALLSGTVAHEINNPLAIISGYMQMLQRQHEQGSLTSAELKSTLAKVTETVFRISKIVNGLKRISRSEHNATIETISVQSLIDETLNLFREAFRSRRIEARVHVPSETLLLECYPVQISQILINVIGNAVDALSQAEERWIEIRVEYNKKDIRFALGNSGPRIPRAIEEKIFNPFFTTKKVGKGTGLGLSLCRQITLAHGGTFELDRQAPHTCFVVTLPRVQRGLHQQKQTASGPPKARPA